ncbi:microcompartment protein CcmL/EutN [Desulfohalotomaculum tongense]|uniref:BMC domain-containing protein n=1 Tax=Desulforadius tongensis TaxID=1216062 RepID=UPI001956999D|nr:BMC domain-containing protein [Desulforadius tongensis]MBM7854164.1 microcompartment protein CcmL/EutN [Desulforadius tongensis]
MQALGLIETRGLLPAIECADVMLKTAQVELVERTFVGGGLVTIVVTGDVGAVKAAVEAGITAVEKIGRLSLVSQHIIPRPHDEIENMVIVRVNPVEEQPMPVPPQEKSGFPQGSDPTANINDLSSKQNIAAESTEPPVTLKQLHKEEVDAFIQKFGLEKSIEALKLLSVAKLRKLAREYKELGITGRAISKANKDLLIKKLTEYYQRDSNK